MDNDNLLKSVDWKVFETQASLLSENVTTMQLELAREWLKSEQFFEVVEERATEGRCGNPICKNSINIPAPNQHYRISFKEKRIYEIDQSSNYCCKECSIQAITYASSLNNNIMDRLRKVKGAKNTTELSGIISEKIPTTGSTIDDVLNALSPFSASQKVSSTSEGSQVVPTITGEAISSHESESESILSNTTQAFPVSGASNKLNIPKRLRRRVPRIPPPILPESSHHTIDSTINNQSMNSQSITDEDAEYEHTLLLLQENEDQKQLKTDTTTLPDITPQLPSTQNDITELLDAFSKCISITENKIIEKSINLPTSTPIEENNERQLPIPLLPLPSSSMLRPKKMVTFHSPPNITKSSLQKHPTVYNNNNNNNNNPNNDNVQSQQVVERSTSTTPPIGKGILMMPFVVAKDDMAPVPMPQSHTSTSSWIESFNAAKVERRFDRQKSVDFKHKNNKDSTVIPPVKNKVLEKTSTTSNNNNIIINNNKRSIFSPVYKGNLKQPILNQGQGQGQGHREKKDMVGHHPTNVPFPSSTSNNQEEVELGIADIIMSRQPIDLQPNSTIEIMASELLSNESDKQVFQQTYGVYLPIPTSTSASTSTHSTNFIRTSSSSTANVNKQSIYSNGQYDETLDNKVDQEQDQDHEEEEEEEDDEEDDVLVNKAPDTLFSQLWIVLSELYDYEALDTLHLNSTESKQSNGFQRSLLLPSSITSIHSHSTIMNTTSTEYQDESKSTNELVLIDAGGRTGQEAMWQLLLRGMTSVENKANLKSKLSSTNHLLYNKCKTTFLEFTNFDRLRPSFTTSQWSLLGTLVIDAIIRKNNFLPFQPIIKGNVDGKTNIGENQIEENWTVQFLELIQFFVDQGIHNNNHPESYKIDKYEIDLLRSYFDV